MKELTLRILYKLYKINNRRIRNYVIRLTEKLDKGRYHSTWLRKIIKDYHGVEIGFFTAGGSFDASRSSKIQPGTKIGKYCSVASHVHSYNRTHPTHHVTTHAMLFNKKLGYVKQESKYETRIIGNDVWLGQNSIILPPVKSIGDGAIIAAGAVVKKDVPPYAIVAGVPAKIIGYRFEEDVIAELLAIKWWDWDHDFIVKNLSHMYSAEDFLSFVKSLAKSSEHHIN